MVLRDDMSHMSRLSRLASFGLDDWSILGTSSPRAPSFTCFTPNSCTSCPPMWAAQLCNFIFFKKVKQIFEAKKTISFGPDVSSHFCPHAPTYLAFAKQWEDLLCCPQNEFTNNVHRHSKWCGGANLAQTELRNFVGAQREPEMNSDKSSLTNLIMPTSICARATINITTISFVWYYFVSATEVRTKTFCLIERSSHPAAVYFTGQARTKKRKCTSTEYPIRGACDL
jgi:hypothetical protein